MSKIDSSFLTKFVYKFLITIKITEEERTLLHYLQCFSKRIQMGFEMTCCRICLANNFAGQSIFITYNGELLPDIIRNVAGIFVFENDGLPSEICFKCADLLSGAQNIRKMCLESDAFLRSQLLVIPKEQDTTRNNAVTSETVQNAVVWTQIISGSPGNIENFEQIEDSEELKLVLGKYLGNSDIEDVKLQNIAHKQESGIDCDEDETKIEIVEEADASDESSDEMSEDFEDNSELMSMQCKYCPKKFSNKIAYKRHHKYHTQEKTKCPICPREFSHKSNLKRHLSVHKDKHELVCDKCGFLSMETKDLYEHLKTHNKSSDDDREEYILECEICMHRTSSLAAHLNHMKEVHNIEISKPFKCHICGIRFTSKQGMYRHIDNIHENNRRNLRNRDKNFLCNACGKKFYTNFHLEVHIRSHTGERPYKCQYCDKSFSQLSGLKMHTFIHTGEKPFACKICGKKFNQYGHVREHQLTHSGERPHVCKICNHSFRVKGNLTAHMMIHTGKKPFTCAECGKGFTQGAKLKAHLEKAHSYCNSRHTIISETAAS